MPLFTRKKEAPAPVEPGRVALPPPPSPRADGLRTMADHRDYLLSCVTELPPFGQQILDALGLSLCEDVVAPISL
ncbi:MAG: molybdopterin molybdenumtransferase MoeA, partial [Actinomycetes bacterium]